MKKAQQLPLDFPCREAMEREDFLISGVNQEAVRWLDAWPQWPAVGLVVFGPKASGKTHLARVWQQQSKAEYVSAAELDNRRFRVLISRRTPLIVDDLERFTDEEALFHLYNHHFQHKLSLLLLAERPPLQLGFALPDLISRLKSLPAAEILPPDEAMLAAIFLKHCHDRQLMLEPDVMDYVIPRMERSFEAAARLAARIDRQALAEKRRITIPFVRQIIGEDFSS